MLTGALIAVVSLLFGMRLGRKGTTVESIAESVVAAVDQPIIKRAAYTTGKKAPKVQDDRKALEAELNRNG